MKRAYALRSALGAAVACLIGGAVTSGCGDDDKGALGDCSACPASAQADCNDLVSQCGSQGVSATDCQNGVDTFCALAGALGGDGGLSTGGASGDGGTN